MDLDLFVLALIESGVSTPYQLQKAAGLSPGATIPALQRLLEGGFVRQGEPGRRGRTEHRITSAGKKQLKDGWRPLLEDGPSGDLDADLRVALLTLWASGERRLAADFLRRSADLKLESIAAIRENSDPEQLAPIGSWYRQLRSASAKALLRRESAAALAMAEALPRNLARNREQKGRTTTQ
jgi:DNA-binding PadR family transcriptional regulator